MGFDAYLLSVLADVIEEVGDVLAQVGSHVLGALLCVTRQALDGTQSLVSCCARLGQAAEGVVCSNVLGVATLGLQPSGLTKHSVLRLKISMSCASSSCR